ncbi:MAG: oligosaccharide flippase family protein [bacterium]|nr:oligosaccharide flippase family protein [bacterium]
MSRETTRRFLHSSGAAIFSQLWRVVVTFGTMLLLKRWISDGDWGLWHWALTVFMILGAARDLGLVFHVVRVKPRPYGNLLAVELIWGSAMVGLAYWGAPLLSRGFSEAHPDVIGVLRALTLFLFFEGLSIVPRVYFEGELRIGRAVAPELVRNLVMAATAIALAWQGFGVWSLVWAWVASAAIYALMLWWRAWGDIPLLFQRGETLALIRESSPLAVIWFLIILVRFIDPLILGWRFESSVVGNYGFAYENAFRMSEIVFPAVGRALYPALVAFREEVRRLFDAYALGTLFIQALELPVAYFLFLNAETALYLLGGAQWEQAPTYLRILCFAPLVDPFTRLGGEILKVQHRDGLWIVCNCITLATFLGGGIYLTGLLGPVGMAWINLLPLGGVPMAWALYRVAPKRFLELVRQLVFVYLVPIPIFVCAWLAAGDHPWWLFAVSLVAVALSLAIFAWRFGRDFVDFFQRPTGASATDD